MEFFRIKKDIPFMRHALIFNVISALTFVAAVFFLFHKGLHLSIEFTGGTVMEVAYTKPANIEGVREKIAELGYTDMQVQSFGTAQDVLIRLPAQKNVDSAQLSQRVIGALKAQDDTVVLKRVEFVGPQVGDELTHDGLMALGMLIIGIVIYLAIRFEWKYAVSAILANLHDVIIILGFFAFFQWEFSLTVLAAVLAVLGYSVNESVVVFDRVRETFRDRKHGLPHYHHARLDATDGAVNVAPWWSDIALLCARIDDWYLFRYLLVGIRRRRACDVAGCQARRSVEACKGKGGERRRCRIRFLHKQKSRQCRLFCWVFDSLIVPRRGI